MNLSPSQQNEPRPCFECADGILEPAREDYHGEHPELGAFVVPDVCIAQCATCGDKVLPHEGHQQIDAYLNKALNVISPEEIGALLTQYRLTQKEASQIFGYGEKNISRWASGRSRPSQSVSNFLRVIASDSSAFERLRAKDFGESVPAVSYPNEERQPDEEEKKVLKLVDYPQLAKLGVVAKTTSPKEKRTQLCGWSRTSNLGEFEKKMEQELELMAAFKDTGQKSNLVSGGIWATLGKDRAAQIKTAPYSRDKLRKAASRLRELSAHPLEQVTEEVQQTLALAGVALVCLPAMKESALRGCTCLLTSNKALIIHSLKYKSYAQFWIILFHEIAHLLLHIEKPGEGFADYENQKEDKKEKEADSWAYDTLFSLNANLEFNNQYQTGQFWHVNRYAVREQVHAAIVAEIVNRRAGKEVIAYSLLREKKLFPNLSERELSGLIAKS